ncbi:MAG: LytR/AlgR family response regulator transcription factor [Bacteroidia bacterium]
MRTIIVEDSVLGVRTLQALIKRYCPHIEVIGTAMSVDEALSLIVKVRPDLILLDIEMPGGDGFSLLEMAQPLGIPFQVIFITAFNQYAIKAIKFSALDYLLKPVDGQELTAAIAKARKNYDNSRFREHYQNLIENFLVPEKESQKLAIPTQEGFRFIPINTIIRCESEGNYIWVFTKDGNSILATRLLKDVEDLLETHRFMRIHRSHLINLDYVLQYQRGDGGIVKLTDGTELSVSRARKDALLNMLKAG